MGRDFDFTRCRQGRECDSKVVFYSPLSRGDTVRMRPNFKSPEESHNVARKITEKKSKD